MSRSRPTLEFPLLNGKPVQVDFSGGDLSSEGGLLLLAQLDRQIGLTERIARCLRDRRLPGRVRHSLLKLIRQRVYQIAAGYEDANDANTLRADPVLKMSVGHAPSSDPDLATQPTFSRLENQATAAECEAINHVLLDVFLQTRRRPPREIYLDFDTTDDPTHGQQELAFFNGHYGGYIYLPLLAFARVVGEGEEFLISAKLRPCNEKDLEGIIATLEWLVLAIRQRWPGVRIIFRGDGHFASPPIFDWLEDHDMAYLIGQPGNDALHRLAAPWQVEALSARRAEGATVRRFGSFQYQAGSWRRARRVVTKAEVNGQGRNWRYVTTWGVTGTARQIYHRYGERGECENRIKELKEGVKSGRTSCRRFVANRFRLLLHAVAYLLFQHLRRLAWATGWGKAQVERLRLEVMKIAARVTESTRRVHVQLCSSYPGQQHWRQLVRRLEIVET